MFYKKKSPHSGACLVGHVVVLLLLALMSVAALIGVYKAHVLSSGLVFGSTSGSLAILAFAVSVTLCVYQCKCCVGGKCEACNGK